VNGLSLSACSLQFNDLNFNQYQQVRILPNPSFANDQGEKNINIEATVCGEEAKHILTCKHSCKFPLGYAHI
jgi:hypothetical protein